MAQAAQVIGVGTRVLVYHEKKWLPGRIAEYEISRSVVCCDHHHQKNDKHARVELEDYSKPLPDIYVLQKASHLHVPLEDGTFRTIPVDPLQRDFKDGDVIECQDYDQDWYPAVVLDATSRPDSILVHYQGWVAKFDEWLDKGSKRIQPYKTRLIMPSRAPLTTYEGLDFCADPMLQAIGGLECVICAADVVCKPLNLPCCGQLVCRYCVELFDAQQQQPAAAGAKTCLVCKAPQSSPLEPNLFLAQKIAQLSVRCPKKGCNWTGPLGMRDCNLEQHLDSCQSAAAAAAVAAK